MQLEGPRGDNRLSEWQLQGVENERVLFLHFTESQS